MKSGGTGAPVTILPGVGRGLAECFERLGVRTVGDLLAHYPDRHENRDTLGRLAEAWKKTEADPGYIATILGRCQSRSSFMHRGREVVRFEFTDDEHEVDVPAWSPRHRFFKVGGYYLLTGKLKAFRGQWSLALADYEVYDEELAVGESLNLGRIVPIYPGTEGLSQKRLRQAVFQALEITPDEDIDWALPVDLVRKQNLPSRHGCLRTLHFPEDAASLDRARDALVFEELYTFQHALALRKMAAKSGKESGRYRSHPLEGKIKSSLPFELTPGQHQVLSEITVDMDSPAVMQRLLHGEVGSGKTVVALLAMVRAALSGHQAVLMAPTDLLARQHERVFREVLAPHGMAPALVVGAMPAAARDKARAGLRSGEIKLAVGTQALFSDDCDFVDLTLVVVDEQHRFGVEQRNALTAKGRRPDLLLMSATPIPQTLSLSIFGDLDISTLPKRAGGQERKTKVLDASNRIHAYRFLVDRLRRGEQAFVVFPAIGAKGPGADGEGEWDEEKAQALGVKTLLKEAAFLKEKVFQAMPVGVLHGKVEEAEREKIMGQFAAGETKALLATTVVEVGIDVPRATVLVVENAERFGLSQLHQLRGRVGRGALPGFVYLIPRAEAGEEAMARLGTFAQTEDGFAIAQLDLEMRGPGELLGSKQAGMLRFRLANLVRDYNLLSVARTEAQTRVTRRATEDHAAETTRRNTGSGLPPG